MTNDFASQFPFNYLINGCFIVENIITNSNKTIKIFDYPIPVGNTRDLLRIPGVSEDSIRASLLKGTLRNKLLAGEIRIICSDINLLQFNNTQKTFLMQKGVVDGLEVSGGVGSGAGGFDVQDFVLLGDKDNINTTFNTVDKFKHLNNTKEVVYLNGLRCYSPNDYFVAESGGVGTGYDTVIFTNPPEPDDIIIIDYFKAA